MKATKLIHLLNEAIQAEGKDLDVWVWEYDQETVENIPDDLIVNVITWPGDKEKVIIIEG